MSETRPPGDQISGTITNNSGQAGIGKDINQTQTSIDLGGAPTAEELQQLAAASQRFGPRSSATRRLRCGTRLSSRPRPLSRRRLGQSRTSR